MPDYDPARAFLTLAEIKPVPEVPESVSPQGRPLSSRGAKYLQHAEELIAEERYAEAARSLEKALRSDPAAPEIHRVMAVSAFSAGNTERARSHAAEAVCLNADDLVSHYLLGRMTFDDGDRGAAIRHFRIALSRSDLDSNTAYAALAEFYLAQALEAEGYLTAALNAYSAFERRAAVFTDAHLIVPQELVILLHVNRGSAAEPIAGLYERLGRFAEAAEALGRLFEQGAPDVQTRLRYVRLLAEAKRYDDALRQCRIASDDEPRLEASAVVDLLVDIRQRMGAPEMVLDDVRAVVHKRPDDQSWLFAYVDLLRRFNRGSDAEHVLAEHIADHPDAAEVAWKLCDDYLETGRGSDALKLAARVVAANRAEYAEALVRVDRLSSDEQMAKATLATLESAEPDAPAERYLLGTLALRLGQVRRGVALLRNALERAPDFTPARLVLAEQLLAEYRWQKVIDLLKAADRTDANLEWALGQAYSGLDEHDQAVEHYIAAIRLNRADTRSMFELAQAYERTDRPLRAQRQYETLLEIDPLHERAREALVGLLVASRLFGDAEVQVRELDKLAASPNCIARCAVRIKLPNAGADVDGCRLILLDGLEKGGTDADSLALVATIDIARDDAASAEEFLSRALAVQPDHVDSRELLVWVYRRELRFERAASELRALLRRYPNRRQWVKNLYGVLMIEQDYDGAVEAVSSFLRKGKLSGRPLGEFRLSLLQAFEAAKRFEEEIAAVQAWLSEDDANRTLRGWLVGANLVAGHREEALTLARKWYLADPADPSTVGVYREVLLETGRFAAAEQLVLEAMESDPGNESLQLALIDILVQAEQFDAALELLKSRLLDADQTFSFLVRELGLYEQAKRFSDAAALAGRMLQDERLLQGMGPLNQSTLRRQLTAALISALVDAERLGEAQVKLSRWIDQTESPTDKFNYLNLLSIVHQKHGREIEALESLELAYSLNPADVGINNDLGYSLADRGERLDEAERMIRFAVARGPTNSAFLDSLGWILYRRGGFAEAKQWLLKATRGPEALEDPVNYDHLGDTCWRLGERDEAVEHWKRAAALAEERLQEHEDPVYRRVVESVGEKLKAVEGGQPPPVATVIPQGTDAGTNSSVGKEL